MDLSLRQLCSASCSQRPLAAVQVSILAGVGTQAELHLSHPLPGCKAAAYSCKGGALLNSRERPPSKGYDVVMRWPAWVRLNVPKTEDSIFLWFQPGAETPVTVESGKQISVVQGLASLSSHLYSENTREPRLDAFCRGGFSFILFFFFLDRCSPDLESTVTTIVSCIHGMLTVGCRALGPWGMAFGLQRLTD